jgi:hypothetical protein
MDYVMLLSEYRMTKMDEMDTELFFAFIQNRDIRNAEIELRLAIREENNE